MPTELSDKQAEFANGRTSTMVIACPGAGKTRAIAARYLNRASASSRKGVALLSFTNAAVNEVGRRCSSTLDLLNHPHFVGTFDSFIQRLVVGPRFATDNSKVARFIETWDVQDITKIIPNPNRQFESLSLESFDFDEHGAATLVPSRISATMRDRMVEIYEARKNFFDTRAAQIRSGRLERGFVSCSEARRQTLFWLRDPNKRSIIAARLASRFSEVIVDEAQDCGPEELELLRALREAGVVISIVGDPDQGIFEFRSAVPDRVVEFGQGLESQITFSDNYRSSRSICKLNSALRVAGVPDVAKGELAECEIPVHVLGYASLPDVAPKFRELLVKEQISEADSIVISHKSRDARKAALASDESAAVNRFSFIGAKTGLILRDPTASPGERRRAVDRLLKKLLDIYTDVVSESFDDAALALGTSVAELKGTVVRIALSLDASALTREQFARSLRQKIESLSWPVQPGLGNIAQIVSVCPEADWLKLGLDRDELALPSGTVHSVKGLEFEAVCLAIPKIRLGVEKSGLQAWLDGEGSESRRVLYVGASRAKRLLVIAVHQDNEAQVRQRLEEAGVDLAQPDCV